MHCVLCLLMVTFHTSLVQYHSQNIAIATARKETFPPPQSFLLLPLYNHIYFLLTSTPFLISSNH